MRPAVIIRIKFRCSKNRSPRKWAHAKFNLFKALAIIQLGAKLAYSKPPLGFVDICEPDAFELFPQSPLRVLRPRLFVDDVGYHFDFVRHNAIDL